MIKARVILRIMEGQVDGRTWNAAIDQEPPVKGAPQRASCAKCPLRPGGDWEHGLLDAIRRGDVDVTRLGKRWGCHKPGDRPCFGAQRIAIDMTRHEPSLHDEEDRV